MLLCLKIFVASTNSVFTLLLAAVCLLRLNNSWAAIPWGSRGPDPPLSDSVGVHMLPIAPPTFCTHKIFVNEMVDVHDLDPVVVPRLRRPPQRYCGQGTVYAVTKPEERYRIYCIYYAVIDDTIMQPTDRFNQESDKL
jgi:hypothetical protein